jgi:PAS domain S-box-containing protein
MPKFLIRLGQRTFTPAGIAIAYAVVGTIWILLSDRIVTSLGRNAPSLQTVTLLQTSKGLLVIALTAGFIYLLIRTAARAAEASNLKLQEYRARYEQLFLRTGAVVLITDSETGAIVDANPAAVRFYGWSHEALLGKTLPELTVQSDEQMRGEYEAAAIEGRDFVLLRHRIASGEIRELAASVTPITTSRRKLDYLVLSDLTRQRTLEHQLRHAQKMEAVGQLTGGIAHDLNNILTVVMADADLLADELPRYGLDVQDDLDDLRSAARRGASMIRKLLSFSRNTRLNRMNADFGRLIESQAPALRRTLPDAIEVSVQDFGAGNVLVDGSALEQILLNLAANSRDAMPNGGSIRFESGRTFLNPSEAQPWIRHGPYVYLKVTDTGDGMDERTRSRVFEPFFTTKPPHEGTGLGMAMIYGLVKQHEGFVDVESQVGGGTTVKIYFPPAPTLDGQVAESQPVGAARASRGGETILVVEDEQALQRAAQRILERLGYQVILAPDGEAALEVMDQQGKAIDLVISDVIMPRVGGQELFERARARGFATRFLFTSGYTSLHPAPLPDAPFLQKPWTYDELARKVREVLDS